MFSYTAYGLCIRSTLPLPELAPCEARADVEIRLGSVDDLPSEAASEKSGFAASAREACLWWADIGTFLVRSGNEIIVDPVPGVEERVLRLFLLGPTLALLLHQRGRLVLHASAVGTDHAAIAILGESGQGKSTLAAALYARGFTAVADDVVSIQIDTIGQRVSPGFPQFKLWPEAAAALGYAVETMPWLHPSSEKRALCAHRGFSTATLAPKRFYVLADGLVGEIELLRRQEALIELLRHSYCNRVLDVTEAPSHFSHCASLANSVPVRRLRTPRSLPAIPELVRIVEQDLALDA